MNVFFKNHLNIELDNIAELNFTIKGNLKKLNLDFDMKSDLTNSSFNIDILNIKKEKLTSSSIKSKIVFKEGKLKYFENILLIIKDKKYKAKRITLDERSYFKYKIESVNTPQNKIDKINISHLNNKLNLFVLGDKIDFSHYKRNFKEGFTSKFQIQFDITAEKIILDPMVSLSGNLKGVFKKSDLKATALGKMLLGRSSLLDTGKFEINVNDKFSSLNGIGLIGGAETKIILNKKKHSFPEISFDTSDGGKLLKTLGFTKNVRSGAMNLNINFLNKSYDQYEGTIKSKNFSLINAPGIIKSLSILSFSGIQSIVSGQGVSFDHGKANIYFKNNIFNFDKVYLSSQSLGISARGTLNFKDNKLNLRGSVSPIKVISQIISIVPAVGELITGLKKQGLFAGQFKMTGLIKNPKVELNTLSFAPGILREIFSEDWLDKDNFFVKNKTN